MLKFLASLSSCKTILRIAEQRSVRGVKTRKSAGKPNAEWFVRERTVKSNSEKSSGSLNCFPFLTGLGIKANSTKCKSAILICLTAFSSDYPPISDLIHLARCVKFNRQFNPWIVLIGLRGTEFNRRINLLRGFRRFNLGLALIGFRTTGARITCMRMLGTGKKPYLEVFSRLNLWHDFVNDNIQTTISAFRLIKNMSINPKSVEFHQCDAKPHSICFFYHNIKENERDLCQGLLTIENTDSDLKVHALHYANELLVRVHTYIHTYNFICFSRLQKKAAYADVDLLKTYLKYLQHLIGLILQITLKYL